MYIYMHMHIQYICIFNIYCTRARLAERHILIPGRVEEGGSAGKARVSVCLFVSLSVCFFSGVANDPPLSLRRWPRRLGRRWYRYRGILFIAVVSIYVLYDVISDLLLYIILHSIFILLFTRRPAYGKYTSCLIPARGLCMA